MLKPLFNIAPLLQPIASDGLIITANNRLASKTRQAWAQYQAKKGHHCWKQPAIFSLDTWLQEQWQQLCDLGLASADTVLSPAQEQILWEKAISNDGEKPADLPLTASAKQASQAYRTVQQWQITDDDLTRESPTLKRWITLFREQLKKHRFITASDCPEQLISAFNSDHCSKQQAIVLVGFQTLSPLYRALLESACDSLETPGLETPDLEKQNTEATAAGNRLGLHQETQELVAAAYWAKQRLQASPNHRIGIVVPDLTRLRPRVERIFREQLQPNYWSIGNSNSVPPFNISAGVPLSETPIIHCALLLLSLNRKQLPLADYCQLLNMPFWGNSAQPELRASAETRLRKLERYELRPNELRYWLNTFEANPDTEADTLAGKLEQFETLRREAPSKAGFGKWMQLFNQQLACVNWPGPRTLDSIEYQQLQHWQSLLEKMVTLDQVQSDISIYEAIHQLLLMANNLPFQPETPDSPVQILGVLEATGLRFDHLWIMGMDNRKWPQPCQPNPLLSVSLQRQYQTPRSLPENELALAEEQLTLFRQHAGEIIFSHSLYDGEQALRNSQLIADSETIELTELLPDVDLSAQRYQQPAAELESIDCSYGPPLDIDNQPVRGGSGIFDVQAACPFNAFARYRLGADQPNEPGLGLSPMERGSLLHQCMELIWQKLGSQSTLLAMPDDELSDLLGNCIDRAIRPLQQSRPDLMTPRFVELEKNRLIDLIDRWLEIEKQRQPFSIAEQESLHQVEFAGLPLKLRIDRIDQTSDGQQIIIDYKTGRTDVRSWFGERPTQPQLPLYALTGDQSVAAISFATINVTEQGFNGVGKNKQLLPDLVTPDHFEGYDLEGTAPWTQLLEDWQEKLEQLAEEFKTGCADVTIYNKNAIQYQTELLPLNRWSGYVEESYVEESYMEESHGEETRSGEEIS